MQIVYVITNPAMPGLVKIGQSGQEDAQARIDQLYTTGVPVPFKLEFACRVENAPEVEKAMHLAFGPYRINQRREFFKIEPDQAIAILKLLHTADATEEIGNQPSSIDQQSRVASEQLRQRRPNLNFEEMGIPIGGLLENKNGVDTAIVVGPRKVKYLDEEMSLTAATRRVLNIEHDVAPGPQWSYDGIPLRQIYNATYEDIP